MGTERKRGAPRAQASKSSSKQPKQIALPPPERFPHLSAFLAGYLHQDFTLDHKTPADALRAFLAEASPAEREALKRDLQLFLADSDGQQWRDTRAAFAELGGAWQPRSRAAVHALTDEFKNKG